MDEIGWAGDEIPRTVTREWDNRGARLVLRLTAGQAFSVADAIECGAITGRRVHAIFLHDLLAEIRAAAASLDELDTGDLTKLPDGLGVQG